MYEILKAGCEGDCSEEWLLSRGTSSQSEGYSLLLVCRESLEMCSDTCAADKRSANLLL